MKIKILKTEPEYAVALARIEELMDAEPGSAEEDELELLSLLAEHYEDEHYPIDLPDPVEAIKFRMDQEGLQPKDLIKYLGSQSKVSEVLNYKRGLSLKMIRALHEGLGIPTNVLVQEPHRDPEASEGTIFDWNNFPFKDLYKRGYFCTQYENLIEAKKHSQELLADLFAVFRGMQVIQIYCKHANKDIQSNALMAWQARAISLCQQQALPEYSKKELTEEFIQSVIQLSQYSKGPQLVEEVLNRAGIHFVLLSHLPKTYLDGACFVTPERRPVIGLTLRHDRLDNFWFTLAHELAHLHLHMDQDNLAFFDDTESKSDSHDHPEEDEANEFAREMLVPGQYWESIRERLITTNESIEVIQAADELNIGPEIIAGRIRWETGDFSKFHDLIGQSKVRQLFPDIN